MTTQVEQVFVWVMAHYARRAHIIEQERSDELDQYASALCGELPSPPGWHEPYIAPIPPTKRCPACEALVLSQQAELPAVPTIAANRPGMRSVCQPLPHIKRLEEIVLLSCPGDPEAPHLWSRLPINEQGYRFCPVCWGTGPRRGGR